MYYLQRSQPPLLTLMMDLYVTYTKDVNFLQWVPSPCWSAGISYAGDSPGPRAVAMYVV